MTTPYSSSNLPSFPAEDVGLGTAYERLAIYRRISQWYAHSRPSTAVEGPLDGMAGVPGLHLLPLAKRGVRVTVVLPSRAALERVRTVYARAELEHRLETIEGAELPRGRRFDWVLSFNALPLARDWRSLLASLATHAQSLVLFVSHPWSYGTWLVRARRMGARTRKLALFDHASTRKQQLETEIARRGRIEDMAWVDCPWWPDLFVDAGETLAGTIGSRFGLGARPRFVYDAESFPYASGAPPRELASRLRLHPAFESSPLAPIFAHHRAYFVSVRLATDFRRTPSPES